jgi:post-segregation antitoxin (ccd killing protein)
MDEEDTTFPNFFVGQRTYTPDEYRRGPVNFFGGALGEAIDVETIAEKEEDKVDVEELTRRAVQEDPTDMPPIPTTTYRLGDGANTSSFDVRSHSYMTDSADRASDFGINYTDFSDVAYGTDKTDNFVKDYLKDTGMGIKADPKAEAALAPLSAMDPSGMLGAVAGAAFVQQVDAPFGKTTTPRPTGIAGLGLDFALAAHAKNAAAVKLAGGKAGALMTVNNMLISRKPGSMIYTGNMQGLTNQEMAGIEATKNGLIAGTMRDVENDDGNIVTTGMKGLMGADAAFQVGGNVAETGYFIDVYGQGAKLTGAAGLENKQFAAAFSAANKKYGVSQSQFIDALAEAQSKAGLFGTVRGKHRNATFLSDALTRMSEDNLAKKAAAAKQKQIDDEIRRQKEEDDKRQEEINKQAEAEAKAYKDDPGMFGDDDDDTGSSAGSSSQDFSAQAAAEAPYADEFNYRQGGRVGMQMGGTAPQASPAGFVERPPSQVSEAATVADDKPMSVPEGTFVINAAAVEMAGEADIAKMLDKAYENYRARRGKEAMGRTPSKEEIDIAVSRGEVLVPPAIAKIIGYDRLEKINNRGKRETKQRIEENGQQAQGAALGGIFQKTREFFGFDREEPQVTAPQIKEEPSPDEGFVSRPSNLDTRPAKPSTPLPEPTNFEVLTADLLQRLEDNKFEGYVPTGDTKNKSGVTIGRGFDLGQHKPGDLERMGLDDNLIARFTPYLDKRGKAARDALAYEKSQGRPLKFTKEEEGILEDLNLTVQRAKYDDFVRTMNKLDKPLPHNDAARAAVFSEFYVGAFKTKQKKGGGLELTIRKSFMDELTSTGNVYSAFQAGIANKTSKGSATRNRAEKTMEWLEENDGMTHSFDKYVGGDDSHYVDTRTGERVPIHTRPTPPPPRPRNKTGMMADVTLPTPKPKRD